MVAVECLGILDTRLFVNFEDIYSKAALTALRTYTARPLAVASFPCILSSQCMESFIRADPSGMVVTR